MRIIKRLIILGLLFFIFILVIKAQNPLNQYIAEALENNGLIKEQRAWIEEKKSGLALANKNWSPEIDFGTSYTLAAGGRSIAFPIGDLLNPAYSELNRLTNSSKFPTLVNQNVQFLPNNFYDARVRISQPILRPEIKTNQLIKKEQLDLQEIQTEITKRDVTQEVKKAYYQYLQASELIKILDQSLVILNESERVSKSLVKNGVAIPSTLLRLETERSKINAQKFTAENQQKDAAAYLNFLRGKSADAVVAVIRETGLPDPATFGTDIKNEEISLLDKNIQIQQLAIDLEGKYNAPRLGAQVDLGSQNFNFKWGGYILGGLQLEIPLWNNKKNLLKQNEISAAITAVKEKKSWAEQGIKLQIQTAKRQLETAINNYHSYTPLLEMAKKYHDELMKRYREGQANQMEIIDALSQITFAETQQSVALYQAWSQAAELERLLKD